MPLEDDMERAIDDALERAGLETFTREPPKSTRARINFLLRKLKTTRAVAAELGVTQRSVERYRSGARKNPPRRIADRIDAAVRARWQPLVRRRRERQAASTQGIRVVTRARFGYTAAPGSTDDGRFRLLTVHLPAPYAARLFQARDQGAGDRELRSIVAEGFQEVYFKDNGVRAHDLEVRLTDIEFIDVAY